MLLLSKENLKVLMDEANRAAEAASQDWLNKAVPRFQVRDKDGNDLGTLLDNCGFAKVVIKDRRSAFYRTLKKFNLIDPDRYTPVFPVSYTLCHRQEMGLHEAAVDAAIKVLAKYNLDSNVRRWAWID